jgi:hypothetical protein
MRARMFSLSSAIPRSSHSVPQKSIPRAFLAVRGFRRKIISRNFGDPGASFDRSWKGCATSDRGKRGYVSFVRKAGGAREGGRERGGLSPGISRWTRSAALFAPRHLTMPGPAERLWLIVPVDLWFIRGRREQCRGEQVSAAICSSETRASARLIQL